MALLALQVSVAAAFLQPLQVGTIHLPLAAPLQQLTRHWSLQLLIVQVALSLLLHLLGRVAQLAPNSGSIKLECRISKQIIGRTFLWDIYPRYIWCTTALCNWYVSRIHYTVVNIGHTTDIKISQHIRV